MFFAGGVGSFPTNSDGATSTGPVDASAAGSKDSIADRLDWPVAVSASDVDAFPANRDNPSPADPTDAITVRGTPACSAVFFTSLELC